MESVLGRRYQPRPTTSSSDDVIIGMIDTGSFHCSFFFLLLYFFKINFLCMLEEQSLIYLSDQIMVMSIENKNSISLKL